MTFDYLDVKIIYSNLKMISLISGMASDSKKFEDQGGKVQKIFVLSTKKS